MKSKSKSFLESSSSGGGGGGTTSGGLGLSIRSSGEKTEKPKTPRKTPKKSKSPNPIKTRRLRG